MRSLSLLLFVALATPTLQINLKLRSLCLSQLVDSPTDLGVNGRISNDTCKQTFPYVGTKEEHEMFCRSLLPFESEAESKGASVTCTWKGTTSHCTKLGGNTIHQIFNKCYYIVKNGGKCEADYSVAKPTNADDIRWIAKLLSGQTQAVRVEKSRVFEDSIISQYIYRSGIKISKSNNQKADNLALIITRLSAFGLYPGDFIYTDEKIPTLCSKQAVAAGGDKRQLPGVDLVTPSGAKTDPKQGISQFGSGFAETKFAIGGGDFIFMTRNMHQAKVENGKVNVQHFHEICDKICSECYAASYETFVKYRDIMPPGRYYLPTYREPKGNKHSCGDRFEISNRKQFKTKINAKMQETHIPSNEQWVDNDKKNNNTFPMMSCSDGERLAVQVVKDGSHYILVDVPPFDYQPVMCVTGTKVLPAKMASGECYKNSVKSGNGCKCKDGFVDALNTTLVGEANELGFFEPGYICITPQKCNLVTTNSAVKGVMFQVDGSGSVNEHNFGVGVNFVRQFKNKLGNNMHVWFCQYGSWGNSYRTKRPEYETSHLTPGWTAETYEKTMLQALGEYQAGGTTTYTHMKTFINQYAPFAPEGKKLLVLLTDGGTSDESHLKGDDGIIALREKYNIETITVAIKVDKSHFTQKDPDSTVIGISDYQKLDSLVATITDRVCDQFPSGHVINSME